jgi:hypothetical protein
MTASDTVSAARRAARRGLVVVACAAAALLLAACGSDEPASDDVATVEAGVVALGTTQNVSCEELGVEPVGGVDRTVFTCGFEEEADQSGEMRPARRCYVLAEDGSVEDVTVELRGRGSCPVTSS